MSAGTSLQGGGGLTLEQRVERLESALRGGPPVVNALGAPTDGTTDLGSALHSWETVFAQALNIAGDNVNVAAFAAANPAFVFTADEPAFAWPTNDTMCLALLVSGCTGGHGSAPNLLGGRGGATTVTRGGMTLTTGQPPRNGTFASESDRWGNVDFRPSFPWVARGWESTGTQVAPVGRASAGGGFFTGLSVGDVFGIDIGAGGAAGRVTGSVTARQSEAGRNGFAILFAIG